VGSRRAAGVAGSGFDDVLVSGDRVRPAAASAPCGSMSTEEAAVTTQNIPMTNPFAAPVAPAAPTAASADPDNIRYGIVAAGPPVAPDEVETHTQALEVVLMWGDSTVLNVAHLSPPRSYYIGEGAASRVDFLVGSESLGAERMPVVVASGGGEVAVVLPQGATGDVTIGEQSMSIAELVTSGRTEPCSELSGAQQFSLTRGATAKVRYNGFTFLVKPVNAGKRVGTGLTTRQGTRALLAVLGASLFVHGSLLLMMFFTPPSPSVLSLDLIDSDSRLVSYLSEPPETVEDETPWLDPQQVGAEGGEGQRHADEEGAMGATTAKKTHNRYGIRGPRDNTDPHMAREQAREQASHVGMLGALQAVTGSWNAPTSPYGRDTALGQDEMSALGALMGEQTGENFGFNGLGVRGTGHGGGGTGEGTVGLGPGGLATIGHGGGGGHGNGYGQGAGGPLVRHPRVPPSPTGIVDVHGSLSKEAIKRTIQRHINEVRFCYEQGLTQRPDLEGRVTVGFIISPSGTVQSAVVSATTLSDSRVEDCVSGAVRRWTFPVPEGGGIVSVNYPFILQMTGGGE